MARKYDRYGRNRQFRRNPTRSRKFFPYQLPYKSDFRLIRENGTEVSAATASKWRQVVRDITRGERGSDTYSNFKRKPGGYGDPYESDGYYQFMQQTQTPVKKYNAAKTAIGIAGASAIGDILVHTNGLISGLLGVATMAL